MEISQKVCGLFRIHELYTNNDTTEIIKQIFHQMRRSKANCLKGLQAFKIRNINMDRQKRISTRQVRTFYQSYVIALLFMNRNFFSLTLLLCNSRALASIHFKVSYYWVLTTNPLEERDLRRELYVTHSL